MATSGQFDGAGGYQGRTLQFAWTRTSYSLQGNYSDIYWEVRVVGGTSSYYYHYHEHAYINGQQIHGMDSRTQRYKGTVASGTRRLYHDSNGDCRFDVRLYAAVYTSSYNVDIEVYANDRSGLLADVTKAISSTKANIVGVNAKAGKDRIAIIELIIETKNLEELNTIFKAIRKVDSVYEVKRKKV